MIIALKPVGSSILACLPVADLDDFMESVDAN